MTYIDFCSDLHTEINSSVLDAIRVPEDRTNDDTLVLAGDILCYRYFHPHRTDSDARSAKKNLLRFLEKKCAHYKDIIFIPGNHEYYGFYMEGADQWFQDIIRTYDGRVIVLQDDHIVRDNFVLCGSTFWTSFSTPDDPYKSLIKRSVQQGMNDYAVIRRKEDDRHSITADYTEDLHNKSFQYIKQLTETFDVNKKLIVVTHHGPSMMSHNAARLGDNDLRYGYLSEYANWIADSKIDYWIHGHTHHNIDYHINQCHLRSAMYGYVGYDRPVRERRMVLGRIELTDN